MKFKIAVIGILIAILSVNIFTSYTIIQEQKRQAKKINALIEVEALEYGNKGDMVMYERLRQATMN